MSNWILASLGDLANKRVSMDSVSGDHHDLAIKLFEAGAALVVSDKDKLAVHALSKILNERSGSMTRYRQVQYSTIQMEPVDIFINFTNQDSIGEVNEGFAECIHGDSLRPAEEPIKPQPEAPKSTPVVAPKAPATPAATPAK